MVVKTRLQRAQVLWLPPVESVLVWAGTQHAGKSLHLLAIRFLSVPKGSAVSWPHLGLAELCFSQLNSLPSPQQVFLRYPCLCHAPHLLQPSSAADGDHPPDACPKFTAAASLPCISWQGSPAGPCCSSQPQLMLGSHLYLKGDLGFTVLLRSLPWLGVRGTVARAAGGVQVQAG